MNSNDLDVRWIIIPIRAHNYFGSDELSEGFLDVKVAMPFWCIVLRSILLRR